MAAAMACHQPASRFSQSSSSIGTGLRQVTAPIAEPKWKQKLAAADQKAEQIRKLTLQAEEDYKRKQAKNREASFAGLVSLNDLEFIPYLTESGMIVDCTDANAKASLYAVYDDKKVLQYIGISRQIHHSMRLHFARMPTNCYYVKVFHTQTPSRSLLEQTREKWISECAMPPPGVVDATLKEMWENPLDCKPLMTDEEVQLHEEAGLGPPRAKVLKNVARRIEKGLQASFDARQCKEVLRFDPKLKEKGLLDIKNLSKKA